MRAVLGLIKLIVRMYIRLVKSEPLDGLPGIRRVIQEGPEFWVDLLAIPAEKER